MPKRPIRLIVVDDSATLRLTLERFLGEKYELKSAPDGEAGIALYNEFSPDVVLLDINMPGTDGFGVIEHIRTVKNDRHTFILMLTADEDASLKPKALNMGANDFLLKPFDRTELMARVGVAERQTRLHRELHNMAGRLRNELHQVAELQEKLLPRQFPSSQRMRVDSMYTPSGQASGDYYDLFPAGNGYRAVIADVSGHGARAAFIMAMVRTLFRLTGKNFLPLVETVTTVNEQLREVIGLESDFVSLFAADIDLDAKSMNYVNAGHCPGMLRHPDGQTLRLDPDCTVLGFFELQLVAREVELHKGSELFLFTDGFYEWKIDGGDTLGIDVFWQLAQQTLADGQPFLETLMRRLAEKAQTQPAFTDDLTALWLRMELDS